MMREKSIHGILWGFSRSCRVFPQPVNRFARVCSSGSVFRKDGMTGEVSLKRRPFYPVRSRLEPYFFFIFPSLSLAIEASGLFGNLETTSSRRTLASFGEPSFSKERPCFNVAAAALSPLG